MFCSATLVQISEVSLLFWKIITFWFTNDSKLLEPNMNNLKTARLFFNECDGGKVGRLVRHTVTPMPVLKLKPKPSQQL